MKKHLENISPDAFLLQRNEWVKWNYFGIVRSVGDGLMLVGDLKNYIFDEVVLYRENPEVDGEYINIHKGFICTSPISILNLEVRTIGAKRKGVVDIRVK